ncbi:DUF2127 domain-containing protein [Candidatus Parcubacteria bacterium]|nr:DUF2127 domain-containing protein [Candidatus Parcubacteria bacterium]
MPQVPEKDIRAVFVISLVLKAIGAAAQIVLGFALLFTSGVTQTIISLAQNELIEDPNDFFATHVAGLASHALPGAQLFGSIYLLSHGVIKMLLVWGLIKNKLWAYPASMAVFTLFIVYQSVRFASTHSVFLILLTIFDIFVIWLIWHEYRYLSKKRHIR